MLDLYITENIVVNSYCHYYNHPHARGLYSQFYIV